jgi:hypothetical protein
MPQALLCILLLKVSSWGAIMKLLRMCSALVILVALAGVAYVGQAVEPAGLKMTRAADRLLASLSDNQKTKAVFAFDDAERTNWHFVPLQDTQGRPTRKGLPLQEMSDEQKETARALVKAGTSPGGFVKAMTIMSLESILRELEKGGRLVRDPQWYFFALFGSPSKTGRWGWRVEGHHLSLNFVIDGSKIVAATPAFFGANPATVKAGPRKGLRTLPEAEDLAQDLYRSLDDQQKKVAHQPKEFPEIEARNPKPAVGAPKGLVAAQMTEKQREILWRLLQAYAGRMPPEVGEQELAAAREGLDTTHFAYAGGLEPGQPHTYRVQGPSFRVEFLNVQPDSANNPANHIHSVWRNIKGDFGLTE